MANPDTVTIGSDTFDVYAPVADADTYFNGKFNRTSWISVGTTEKQRALVSATRLFDIQPWDGVPTDLVTPQPISWPRTGMTDKNDQSVGSTIFPADLLNGFYELAQAIIDDPSLADSQNTSTNIRSAVAGPAEVEFFRPESGPRLPNQITEYIAPFLSGDPVGSTAYGDDKESTFDDENRFKLNKGWA